MANAERRPRSRRLFSRQYSASTYLDAFERSGMDDPACTPKTGNPFTGTRLIHQVVFLFRIGRFLNFHFL